MGRYPMERETALSESGVLRWGILGLGEIAHTFAAALADSRTGRLEAAASSDRSRATAFAARFGARAARDYDDLISDPEIDAVYIASVHTDHVRWAVRAAEAGKHVLCEKPLSPHPATTMAMIEAARAAGVVLVEGYMYRFHPQIQRMLELIAAGEIGAVRHVRAAYCFNADRSVKRLYDPDRAGGAILDIGGYPLSLAMEVAAAAAGTPGHFSEPREILATAELSDEGVDLATTAHADFAGPVTVHLRAAIGAEPEHTAIITGSAGSIEIENPWIPAPDEPTTIIVTRRENGAERVERIEIAPALPYALEADAVAALIRGEDVAGQTSEANSEVIARTQLRWRQAVGLRYPFEDRRSTPSAVRADVLDARGAEMRYGAIPQSEKRISRLVMGCDNQPDIVHAGAMWDHFFENGGNAFDTAYEYNDRLQEKLLGQWLSDRGVREESFVIGKGGHTPYCTPEDLEQQLIETLEDLQTGYLDMYFMHRDNPQVPVGEFIDVLDRFHVAGAIRAFGGSNWSIARFEEAASYARQHGKQPMTALSNHFGLAEAVQLPWAGCEHATDEASKRWLSAEQVPLFAWASQARGFFARADRADTSDAELVRCFYSDDNFERLDRCRALATELHVAPTAVALAYVLHQDFPTFALFGPRSLAEMRTSMEAVEIELTSDQVAWLDLRA